MTAAATSRRSSHGQQRRPTLTVTPLDQHDQRRRGSVSFRRRSFTRSGLRQPAQPRRRDRRDVHLRHRLGRRPRRRSPAMSGRRHQRLARYAVDRLVRRQPHLRRQRHLHRHRHDPRRRRRQRRRDVHVTVNNVDPTLDRHACAHSDRRRPASVSFDASFTDPGFDNPLNPGGEKAEIVHLRHRLGRRPRRDHRHDASPTRTAGPVVDPTGHVRRQPHLRRRRHLHRHGHRPRRRRRQRRRRRSP